MMLYSVQKEDPHRSSRITGFRRGLAVEGARQGGVHSVGTWRRTNTDTRAG